MIVKLEDFLRRRSKIALVVRKEAIRTSPGLLEACEILFGDEAQQQINAYFGPDEKGGEGEQEERPGGGTLAHAS
jgi:glycerol-3-phosphate dehydrogenase